MPYRNFVSHGIMDNSMFGVPIDMAGRISAMVDGVPSHTTNSLVQSDSFHLNNQDHIMAGFPVLSTMQEPPVNDLYAGGAEFHEQFTGGTVISGASLATLLAARSNVQENPDSLVISAPTIHPFEVMRNHGIGGCSDALNFSFATSSMNCGYDEVVGNVNRKWDFDKFPVPLELGGKSLDPNGWISSTGASMSTDHPYGSSKFSNELSLSLATSQSSVSGTSHPDQCSEMSCSAVTHPCLNETVLGSEQASCNSKERSLTFGSHYSQAMPGSRYLQIIQEILAQIASYSMENVDQMSYSTGRVRAGSNLEYSSSCLPGRGTGVHSEPEMDGRFEVQIDPELQKRAVETKKHQLLALLQVVDDRYTQCMDEIHTVISAFHAATELDPQKHASFALRTVSFLYKNLRERISNQILLMGEEFNSKSTIDKERSFEASFIQRQWTLQQQKRQEHQLWRPQRGLPERSVSVLRAWMFQNFLHPYPKDAEKHLLALKSGLTRSQVSNWFINARVRLWKPMIEEMYSEMNKRKAAHDQYEEGTNNSNMSHISQKIINNLRYNMN